MAQQYAGSPGKPAAQRQYAGQSDTVAEGRQVLQARTSGWAVFASVMLALAGAFGMINGLIALIHDEVYVVGEEQIVAFDFTQWGWVHLIGGAVVMLAGFALTSGALWARIIGVIVAFLHALSQVAFIEAYPFWSLTIIALDAAVIYGCLVHGDEMQTA